jgi:hypothetical protein
MYTLYQITWLWEILQTWQVVSPSPSDHSLSRVLMLLNVWSPFPTYIHTYHSRFISEGAAEASQIFLRDATFYKIYLAMSNTADVTGGKPIAVWSRSISGANAINPLVAFYDIHGGKRKVLFFYFVPYTTRDLFITYDNNVYVLSYVRPKARLAKLLQYDINANVLAIISVQSPKCISWCAGDCTSLILILQTAMDAMVRQ